jgi:hypothetical protein
MAKLIGGAAQIVVINSVTLSDHVTSATLSESADEVDTSAFGDAARSFVSGLTSGQLNISWQQDYASSEVDATLAALVGTVVTFALTPTADAVSATNPKYEGSVLVTDYTPIAAEVGSLSSFSTSWPVTGAITRTVS